MGELLVSAKTEQFGRWLLIFHQLPSNPAYLRVKVWRRLQALGAVAIKNAVYALPTSDQSVSVGDLALRSSTRLKQEL